MAHLWKSELRLELRTNGCYAELRRQGWARKVIATASASGRGASAISAAIAALKMADTPLGAVDARLVVADEYVDFTLLGAGLTTAGAARQCASDHFAQAVGHDDLLVQVTPLPAARGWLAAAIAGTDHAAWTEVLDAARIRLRHVHPAFIEDLRRLSERIVEDDALVVLLREEGATLLRLEEGVPATVTWERFDPSNRSTLETRLRSFARQTGAMPDRPTVVYMLPQSRALCRFVWDGRELMEPRRPPLRTLTGAARPAVRPVDALVHVAGAPRAARVQPQGVAA